VFYPLLFGNPLNPLPGDECAQKSYGDKAGGLLLNGSGLPRKRGYADVYVTCYVNNDFARPTVPDLFSINQPNWRDLMRKSPLNLMITAAVCITHAVASTVLYDFEDTNTLSDDFTFNGTGSQQSTGGLNNSGRLQAPNSTNDFAAVISNGPVSFDTSSDFTVTQSVYFKTTSIAGTEPDDEPVILGLTDQSSQAATGNYALMANNFLNVALRINTNSNSFPSPYSAYDFIFLGSSANGSFTGQGSEVGNLAADSWYFFTVDFTYDSLNDEWDMARSVFNADSDGTVQSLVAGDTFSLSNPFGSNPDLYGFVAGDSGTEGSVESFDNATLVSIPEPSSLLLVGLALGAGALFRNRK